MSYDIAEKLALFGGPKAKRSPFPPRKRHGEREKQLLSEVIDSDILFFYDDPHMIYDHWSKDVWAAIDAHQVKPGMSVTANIVTQVDQNVIAVPNAAVVTSGGSSYILEPVTPLSAADLASSANGGIVLSATKQVPVTVGLANDTMTEIDSGINVGDQIIVQTIKSTTATKTTASTGGTSARSSAAYSAGESA